MCWFGCFILRDTDSMPYLYSWLADFQLYEAFKQVTLSHKQNPWSFLKSRSVIQSWVCELDLRHSLLNLIDLPDSGRCIFQDNMKGIGKSVLISHLTWHNCVCRPCWELLDAWPLSCWASTPESTSERQFGSRQEHRSSPAMVWTTWATLLWCTHSPSLPPWQSRSVCEPTHHHLQSLQQCLLCYACYNPTEPSFVFINVALLCPLYDLAHIWNSIATRFSAKWDQGTYLVVISALSVNFLYCDPSGPSVHNIRTHQTQLFC